MGVELGHLPGRQILECIQTEIARENI